MKILWLSFTPAGASSVVYDNNPGCGWVESLESSIKKNADVNLAVCFFHNSKEFKFVHQGVTYYPLSFKSNGFSGKLRQRIFGELYDTNTEGLKKAIDDFKPDIIHLFGSESGMGEVLQLTDIPVIIHLQGLVNPTLYAWLPKGISQQQIFSASSLRAILFRRGLYFEYGLFQKRALREENVIKRGRYFFGRTDWDKNFLSLHKKEYQYFHCEELLRPDFYSATWNKKLDNKLTFVTVINPQLYKGIEIVLETAKLLKQKASLDFQWNMVGLQQDSELVNIVEKITHNRFENYNVSFKGTVTGPGLISELKAAHFFIHPSHIDNSSNSVCEAMLLGMPVIASNVGGIPTIIDDGVNGVLFNSHDPYDLAGKILTAAANYSHMEELGRNARAKAIVRHNSDKIVSVVMNAYQSVIEKERSASNN